MGFTSNKKADFLVLTRFMSSCISVLFLFIVGMQINVSCTRPACKSHSDPYKLLAPFNLEPAQERYEVGDTIFVHISMDNEFLCLTGAPHTHTLLDQDLQMWFTIIRADTTWNYYEYEDFDFGYVQGRYYPIVHEDDFTTVIKHVYDSNSYSSMFYFILRRPGDYLFNMASDAHAHAEFINFKGKCPAKATYFTFDLHTDVQDNNYYLIDSIDFGSDVSSPYYIGYFLEKDNYDSAGGFFFSVR